MGAQVDAFGLDNWCYFDAWTDSSGNYVVEIECCGSYEVHVHAIGYIAEIYPTPIDMYTGHNAQNIDFALTPVVKIGDVTGNGVIDLGDLVFLINYLYRAGSVPNPLMTGDVNCNGEVNLSDIVFLINSLYKGGPSPCNQ